MAQPAEQTLDFLSVALTPEFRDDPYEFFRLLREHEPVHQTPFGVYLVSRHADASAIVRDPHLSTESTELRPVPRLRRGQPAFGRHAWIRTG